MATAITAVKTLNNVISADILIMRNLMLICALNAVCADIASLRYQSP